MVEKINPLKNLLLLPFLLASFISISQPTYEFRGVWIATVDNIDWPPKKVFNVDSQKADYIRQLDLHKKNGMNAVIVQVRTAADAFYPSPYEPWSQWLTGTQGLLPKPYWDPLQFMIEEAHKRGFEFHAWCNPYRADFDINRTNIAPDHISRLYPQWFLKYGNQLFFDPGNREAQQWSINVMKDIVARYDIDALHMDDYFYPYRIAGREFPDSVSYVQYGRGQNKDDWRRSNVDSIIKKLGAIIKQQKPWVKFGISPFGVWRNIAKDPRGSNTRAGQTNYDDLYADVLSWIKNKWIDYVAPQIYWEFSQPNAPYQVLLEWWNKQTNGLHCYIGLGIYKAGTTQAWRDRTLIPRQIDSLRAQPNINGAIYFSSTSFYKNPNGWNDSLQKNQYKMAALIPRMKWTDSIQPLKPFAQIKTVPRPVNTLTLHMQKSQASRPIKLFMVYKFNEGEPIEKNPGKIYKVVPASSQEIITLTSFHPGSDQLAVSCVDLANNESELFAVEKLR
jgi:uncharacterized lipoprotein YddW (UPF0748 family)